MAYDVSARHPVASQRMLRYFHRVSRPVFLGELSVDLGINLDRAQAHIDLLLEEGLIRAATPDEAAGVGGSDASALYVLVGRPDPSIAHM